jgi:hypothetical protein
MDQRGSGNSSVRDLGLPVLTPRRPLFSVKARLRKVLVALVEMDLADPGR